MALEAGHEERFWDPGYAEELEAERDRLREALECARHWHEQLDYDEALNVIDAALGPGSEGE